MAEAASQFTDTQIVESLSKTARTINGLMLSLLVLVFFSLFAIGQPDTYLLNPAPTVSVPSNSAVSAMFLLVAGPLLLIGTRIHLQICVERWEVLYVQMNLRNVKRVAVLSPMRHNLRRALTGGALYLLAPIALAAFTWKAMAIPQFSGFGLLIVTAFVTTVQIPQFRREGWAFKFSLLMIVAVVVVGAVSEVGVENVRRPFDLRNARLGLTNIAGMDLRSADMRWADLSEANLSEANLSDADISNAILERAYLEGADLSSASLSTANLTNAGLTKSNLKGATLFKANLTYANLFEAHLNFVDLTKANLSGAILISADLRSAVLFGTQGKDVFLEGANLTMADLRTAEFTTSTLKMADLTMADLRGARLYRTNLTNADLTGANLSKSNVSQTNFTNANLTGTNLSNSNFIGVDTLTQLQLDQACIKDGPPFNLPDGLDPPTQNCL